MTIAKQNNLTKHPDPTKDYVHDCLVAMWDGEWNTGRGHNSKATQWTDCISRYVLQPYEGKGCSFGENCAVFNGETMLGVGPEFTSEYVTVEVVTDIVPVGNNIGLFSIFDINRSSADEYRNKRIMTRIAANQLYVTMDADQKGTGIVDQMQFSVIGNLTHTDRLYLNSKVYSCGQIVVNTLIGYMKSHGNTYSVGKCPIDEVNFGSGLTGKVFCIRVYDKELSQKEIYSNYQIDKMRFGI